MRQKSVSQKWMLGFSAFLICAAFVPGITGFALPEPSPAELTEYEVKLIDPASWTVTATDTSTGNIIKFRLPPSVFVGQTFDASLQDVKAGQLFSIKGPKNTRLKRLAMVSAGKIRANRAPRIKWDVTPPQAPMAWKILSVDAKDWIVKAQNTRSNKIIRFKVHPKSFAGFRFRANTAGISQGQRFAIIAPNEAPMADCATLLPLEK
jgi:hypothetical protein